MYCSAKKALVVTIELSQNEAAGAKTTAEVIRSLNNLIVGTTHGQGDFEDFFYNVYGIVDFLSELCDNPERAEKRLAEYINTFRDKTDQY